MGPPSLALAVRLSRRRPLPGVMLTILALLLLLPGQVETGRGNLARASSAALERYATQVAMALGTPTEHAQPLVVGSEPLPGRANAVVGQGAAPGPLAKTWYFAEGYTGPGFDEYLQQIIGQTRSIGYLLRARLYRCSAALPTRCLAHRQPDV